jgi:hypothetical protein
MTVISDNPYILDTEKVIVNSVKLTPPVGVTVSNFTDPNVYRFQNRVRGKCDVNQIILHETVTRDWASTVRVLKPKTASNPDGQGLGVHFIIDPEGVIYQHGDLQTDMLWHANAHSLQSVGIEIVNPYYPNLMPKAGVWSESINAPWADKGKYCLLTPSQAESVSILVDWLSSDASGLKIPKKWVGVNASKQMIMGKLPVDPNTPGVYAHHYFGHADGCWPLLYCWLRTEAKLSKNDAYLKAKELATGCRGKVQLDGV